MGGVIGSVLNPVGRLAGWAGGKVAGKTVNTAKAGGKLAAKGTLASAKGGYSFAKKMYERARNAG